jgi:hypothetical protein
MSTATLAGLLATVETDGRDHATTEKDSGFRHIHNHAGGTVVWFPTWKKFRDTADWSDAVEGVAAATVPAEGWAANVLAAELDGLLKGAAAAGDPAAYAEANLTQHLTRTWALGDAVAKAAGKELYAGGAVPSVFADYPYDVYAQDGGVFASTLWNDIIDARRQHTLAEEAARKALKPVSRKAMKNAARKAARR